MPKTEEQLNRIKDDRKRQILECALKVFCEKGYDATTINDIVKKAKCSHGLFYHYFNSKKSIFDALTEIRGKGLFDFLDEVIADDSNYLMKLKKMTEYTFNNMKNDDIFAYRYYFFVSTVFHKAESGVLPPKNKIPPHVRLTNFFNEGIEAGDFSNKYPASEYAKIYNCITKGATLNFILCPKEFKASFKFPMIELILDIFRKENSNGTEQ